MTKRPKDMRLGTLRIISFKGIKELEIDFNGNDARIIGKNGAGKTTVLDAYSWLLFNRDSMGKADFGLQTVDEKGNVIHHLEHSVYAEFLIDGNQITLEKVLKENWTKQNGAAERELKSRTTKYKVNGVPHKKGDYDGVIKDIVDEDTFRTITSTTYYNDNMKWQDRRKDLMDKFGNVTDEEVIKSNNELIKLPEMLGSHSVTDFEKILKERRTELKKEIEHIPTRIDELHKSKVDVQGVEVAKEEVGRIKKDLEELDMQISAIKNGSAVQQKEVELSDLNNQINARKNELEKELIEQGTELSDKLNERRSELSGENNLMANNANEIQRLKSQINEYTSLQQGLREQYIDVKQKDFESKVNTHCPTCEQSLPDEEVEKVKQKELEDYKQQISTKLEEINKLGVGYKVKIEENENAIDKLEKEVLSNKEKISSIEKEVSAIEKLLVSKREELKNTRNDGQTNDLNARKEVLEQSIEDLKEQSESALKGLYEGVAKLKEERSDHEEVIAAVASNKRVEERIKELESKQLELQKQLENTELGLYLVGLLVKTKVELLTDKINSHFAITKWKLFDVQVNGGINETCVATYNGVPYDAGLNTGARVLVGLDIANTMSQHYGVRAPIFVDNAESVSEKLDSPSQLIKLYVVPQQKELQVEIDK